MSNLLDLMSQEDQDVVKRWVQERKNPKHKREIPMPFFIAAQLGYYYGWGAVKDFRRGYSTTLQNELNKIGQPTGRVIIKEEVFTLEEAVALIEAARKVDYIGKLDGGRIGAATTVSSNDKKFAKNNADYVNKLAKSVEA